MRRSWIMAHLPGSNRNNVATKTPATLVATTMVTICTWAHTCKHIHTRTGIRRGAVMYIISGLLPLFLLPQSLLPFGLLQFHFFFLQDIHILTGTIAAGVVGFQLESRFLPGTLISWGLNQLPAVVCVIVIVVVLQLLLLLLFLCFALTLTCYGYYKAVCCCCNFCLLPPIGGSLVPLLECVNDSIGWSEGIKPCRCRLRFPVVIFFATFFHFISIWLRVHTYIYIHIHVGVCAFVVALLRLLAASAAGVVSRFDIYYYCCRVMFLNFLIIFSFKLLATLLRWPLQRGDDKVSGQRYCN